MIILILKLCFVCLTLNVTLGAVKMHSNFNIKSGFSSDLDEVGTYNNSMT